MIPSSETLRGVDWFSIDVSGLRIDPSWTA
jgi:hypothetical protein